MQLAPSTILATVGDASRGRQLFFETASVQCKNCHRIDGAGSLMGPDLSNIGRKYTKAQLLDQILDPSRIIEPRYVAYVARLEDGRSLTGMLVDRTPEFLTLRDAKGDVTRLDSEQLESLAPLRQSLMPDLQLRDLSLEQIADLLAYLADRKTSPAAAIGAGEAKRP
jgi:putative heme-binding domain-containing protein